jgi:hypothetical protein
MRKRDEVRSMSSCLVKAKHDEMMFVLLARDAAAPTTIRFWAHERIHLGKNTARDEQIKEALRCAEIMEAERSAEELCNQAIAQVAEELKRQESPSCPSSPASPAYVTTHSTERVDVMKDKNVSPIYFCQTCNVVFHVLEGSKHIDHKFFNYSLDDVVYDMNKRRETIETLNKLRLLIAW